MTDHAKAANAKKPIAGILASFVLGLVLLTATAQPARAMIVNDIVTEAETGASHALQQIEWVWTQVQDQLAKMQVSWAATVEALGKHLQERLANMRLDNANANHRNDQNAALAAKIGVDTAEPKKPDGTPVQSYCHNSETSNTASNDHLGSGGVAQALAQGNANRPKDAATVAKDITVECSLNFAPSAAKNPNDPETSAFTALNCSSTGEHARQDVTIETLIEPWEYPVEPTMPLATNGVYATLTKVSGEQYYPFAAALTFCQHITPSMPAPPKGAAGKATAELINIGPYKTAESGISMAPGACYKELSKRMQVGKNVTAWQARYQEELKRCNEDHQDYIIDDAQFADCQTNGRSELQADRDKAYVLGSSLYQLNIVDHITSFDNKQMLIAMNRASELKFDERLSADRLQLVNSIAAANQIAAPNSSTLGVPLQQVVAPPQPAPSPFHKASANVGIAR